jgi:PAS domain S-box-containing protein
VPTQFITKDLDGIIKSWNKGAERVFGYTAEETVGKPVTILIPPERLDEEHAILGTRERPSAKCESSYRLCAAELFHNGRSALRA